MPSKENDLFSLKLRWISTQDMAERKKLADQIQQLLAKKT